tara:strand:- start:767 stop:1039 length:273 start_codon:yes stop_codon:yes gene_type:complete
VGKAGLPEFPAVAKFPAVARKRKIVNTFNVPSTGSAPRKNFVLRYAGFAPEMPIVAGYLKRATSLVECEAVGSGLLVEVINVVGHLCFPF